jgi:uncharacterized protein (TIGR02145 family)
MKKLLLLVFILGFGTPSFAQETGIYKDSRDGKTYQTIKIGRQTWMAENLAYQAGSGIWAYDNNQKHVPAYGYLYNWKTAQDVCPAGWHLPSNAEWITLTDYVLITRDDGGKLKESDTTHWKSPNTGATNESGFSGLPGGIRTYTGVFVNMGYYGFWWSSTPGSGSEAYYRYLAYRDPYIYSYTDNMEFGFSVRCIRDE